MADNTQKLFKTVFPNFATFKTKLNAYQAGLVSDTDQYFFSLILASKGEYHFAKTQESEIVSNFIINVWEPWRLVLTKALAKVQQNLETLIASSSEVEFTTANAAERTGAIKKFLKSGQDEKIKPSVFNFLRSYIKLPNIVAELVNLVDTQLGFYQDAQNSGRYSPINTDQVKVIIDNWMDERIERHQKITGKVDTKTLQDEVKALETKITTNKNKNDEQDPKITTNKNKSEKNENDITILKTTSDPNYLSLDKTAGKVEVKQDLEVASGKTLTVNGKNVLTEIDKKGDKSDITNNADKNAEQDRKITAIETKNKDQDNKITAIERKNTNQDTAIGNKIDTSTARSEFETQATIQENFGFTDGTGGDIKVKKQMEQVPVGQGSSATLPIPSKPGHLINKKYFDDNKGSGGSGSGGGGVGGKPFKWLSSTSPFQLNGKSVSIQRSGNRAQIIGSDLLDKNKTYKFNFVSDSPQNNLYQFYLQGLTPQNQVESINLNVLRGTVKDNASYAYVWYESSTGEWVAKGEWNTQKVRMNTITTIRIFTENTKSTPYLEVFESGVSTSAGITFPQIATRVGQAFGRNFGSYHKINRDGTSTPPIAWKETTSQPTTLIGRKINNFFCIVANNGQVFKDGITYTVIFDLHYSGTVNGQQINIGISDDSGLRTGTNNLEDYYTIWFSDRSTHGGPTREWNKNYIFREPNINFGIQDHIRIEIEFIKLANQSAIRYYCKQYIFHTGIYQSSNKLLTKHYFEGSLSTARGTWDKIGIDVGNTNPASVVIRTWKEYGD